MAEKNNENIMESFLIRLGLIVSAWELYFKEWLKFKFSFEMLEGYLL